MKALAYELLNAAATVSVVALIFVACIAMGA